MHKAIDTGWTPRVCAAQSKLVSDVLSVWGMTDLGWQGTATTDAYVISMSYDPSLVADGFDAGVPVFGIAVQSDATWVNVGSGAPVSGAYPGGTMPSVGTWGVDTATHTAWAVVKGTGPLAVAKF
jgi:hypothetical protein